jgi:hypothetical protein
VGPSFSADMQLWFLDLSSDMSRWALGASSNIMQASPMSLLPIYSLVPYLYAPAVSKTRLLKIVVP